MRRPKDLKGRGKSLYSAVTMSRYSNKDAAVKAGYKENTFYSHIKQEFLDFAVLERYGRAIKYDFSIEYPEMEDIFPTMPKHQDNQQKDYENLQSKYMTLLEKHKDLMEKYSDLQDRLNTMEKRIKK